MQKVKVVQFGIGGWGWHFFENALATWPDSDYAYEGAIDPNARQSPIYDKLLQLGIPVYESPEAFYSEHRADLAVITASLPAHCPMTLLALSHGSNVLCEKPAAGTLHDVDLMLEAAQKAGRFVAINFNRCYAPASVNAKRDFLAGKFGRPKRFRIRSICGRDDSYYFRNYWSSRILDINGEVVLDSVLCNGTSHELQHALFMQGARLDAAACPVAFRADLLRANPIETFDTCVLDARTDAGAEVLCYVTHATDYTEFPVYDYEYENACLRYNRGVWGDDLIAFMKDGSVIHYGEAFPDGTRTMKLCAQAILNKTQPVCGLEASRVHVLTINALADYAHVSGFPACDIKRDEAKKATTVPGLGEKMVQCYDDCCLLSDKGYYALKPAEWTDISAYSGYLGGRF